jgi:Ca-activated chloride channel family protein
MSSSDPHLDAKLRAVSLPEGLTRRLRAIPLADDEGLDAAVRDVPVPRGLRARLLRVPLADDAGLDAALRDVPVPESLTVAWRHRVPQRDQFVWLTRLATAACLLVAVSLTYFCVKLVSLVGSRSEIAASLPSGDQPQAPAESLAESWAARGAEEPADLGPPALPPEVGPAKIDASRPATGDLEMGLAMPRAADPLLRLRPSSNVIGGDSFDNLPELPKRVWGLVPRGIEWPAVRGSHLPFLIQYGFHPFVSPADDPRLKTCVVPLGADSSSFELTRRYVEDGELPPPDVVRTEEFLAAVPCEFPRPDKRDLGVTVAGGPSPFGGEGFCLLQIGVQSREVADAGHAPVQLILLVDTSASMGWGSRIEVLRRALREYASRLAPDDRLSLISFNQAAHVLIQDVGPAEVRHFRAALDWLSADGTTEVALGLDEAYLLARQLSGPHRPAARVVLLSDGLLELDHSWMERIQQQVSEAADRGTRLDVVDLGQEKQSQSQMAALAEAGHGTLHRAASAQQVGWALREIVSGRSELTARDAELRVTFNPKTVLEYRLLGHEANDFARMLSGPLHADFHDGQSATALFEVRLAASGPKDVATVDLTWYPADSKQSPTQQGPQQLSANVTLRDFAALWSGAAPSLQEAALAAETAEVLRRSPFVFKRTPRSSTAGSLARISDLAGTVDSRLYQRPEFVEFVALVDQAIHARPARGARNH